VAPEKGGGKKKKSVMKTTPSWLGKEGKKKGDTVPAVIVWPVARRGEELLGGEKKGREKDGESFSSEKEHDPTRRPLRASPDEPAKKSILVEEEKRGSNQGDASLPFLSPSEEGRKEMPPSVRGTSQRIQGRGWKTGALKLFILRRGERGGEALSPSTKPGKPRDLAPSTSEGEKGETSRVNPLERVQKRPTRERGRMPSS